MRWKIRMKRWPDGSRSEVVEGPDTQRIEVVPLARLQEVEGEAERLKDELGQCYRLSGADPDGDDNAHLAQHAVQAVRELREESDANCDEELTLRESAETRLREALTELEAVRYALKGARDWIRRRGQHLPLCASRTKEAHCDCGLDEALVLIAPGVAEGFAEANREATDPNSTEPMASGAAGENWQRTSDSEDKAVPGLATEGDE